MTPLAVVTVALFVAWVVTTLACLDLARRLRAADDTEAWLDTPAGCCTCGTGGPYYRGRRQGLLRRLVVEPQVSRYAYTGATVLGEPGGIDWVACSRHALPTLVPVVDLGEDKVITSRDLEAAVKA